MMKVIIMILLLLVNYKFYMFIYNLCFMISFLMLFMYMFKINVFEMGYFMNMDSWSYILMLLSIWIISLMYMSIINDYNMLKNMMFMIMLLILLMSFLMKNLLMFYFFFEISLIPTFIMIIYMGLNLERLMASFYMLMYTMFISMPFLVYLLKIFLIYGSLDIYLLVYYLINMNISYWQYLMLLMIFFIKMPMYLFHIWLPKAHVEAPVFGSMILAGVLLKLGSYGLVRFLSILKFIKYNYYIYLLGLFGSLVISLLCLIQVDMKMLVAYSSVVHMNLMLAGMMTMFKLGIIGSVAMMVAHGLCSSGLFYMVNLFYIRTGSRMLMFNKGLVNVMPSMMLLWFILCIMNFSFPLSLNFISEIFLLMSIIMWDYKMIILLFMVSFFSSAYSLYLFSYVYHGELNLNYLYFNNGYLVEYFIVIIHFIPLFMLLLNLNLMY